MSCRRLAISPVARTVATLCFGGVATLAFATSVPTPDTLEGGLGDSGPALPALPLANYGGTLTSPPIARAAEPSWIEIADPGPEAAQRVAVEVPPGAAGDDAVSLALLGDVIAGAPGPWTALGLVLGLVGIAGRVMARRRTGV